VILTIKNPFARKASAPQVEQPSTPAKAVENTMSTTAVVPAVQAKNGFLRFIDAIGHFFQKVSPVVEQVAIAAEPFLALTPFGPEYDLVVNAIIGVQKTATASIAAGVNLSGPQKMGLVLQSVTPGLNTILTSKGVTQDTETHIANWTQLVFGLLSGPVGAMVSGAAKPVATTGIA
jgi:hypothetical protein